MSAPILFDLDGTIIDSGPGIIHSLLTALDVMGVSRPDESEWSSMVGPPLWEMFSRFGLEGDDIERAIVAYRTEYRAVGMYDFTVYDGMAEALRELQGRGERLAIATAKLDQFAIAMLTHAGLEDCFEVIAGVDPEGTRRTKVAVMRHCFEELAWSDHRNAVMIGDRSHDGEGAAELGTPFVGVSWGYGGREELASAGASVIVDSPGQLVGHLLPRG